MSESLNEQKFAPIPDSVGRQLPAVDDQLPPDEMSFGPAAQTEHRETFRASPAAIQMMLVALLFLALGFAGGAAVFGSRGVTPSEVEAIVRSVVAEEVARAGGPASTVSNAVLADNDPGFGPVSAPITVVEFSDFYCTFCTRFANQTLPLLRQQYGDMLRFVYRDLPIIGGQASFEAAVAGNCAHSQGKFWEFHDLLFANNDARDRASWIGFAGDLGMDAEAFAVCLDDRAMQEEVTLDYLDGQGLGIQGTPAFYINGRAISGAQPFDTFALVIDAELRKLGITPPERIELPGS